MRCDSDELRIRYSGRRKYHIYEVDTMINGQRDLYRWNYLKHSQRKVICGNEIEFHRYYAGINVRVLHWNNREIKGLFNDSRCLESLE